MYPLDGLLVGSAIFLVSTLPPQHTSAEVTFAGEIPKHSGIALVR